MTPRAEADVWSIFFARNIFCLEQIVHPAISATSLCVTIKSESFVIIRLSRAIITSSLSRIKTGRKMAGSRELVNHPVTLLGWLSCSLPYNDLYYGPVFDVIYVALQEHHNVWFNGVTAMLVICWQVASAPSMPTTVASSAVPIYIMPP